MDVVCLPYTIYKMLLVLKELLWEQLANFPYICSPLFHLALFPSSQEGHYSVGYFADLRVGRELSFFKKLRSNPAFIASIKVFQQLISFKWVQIIKYF